MSKSDFRTILELKLQESFSILCFKRPWVNTRGDAFKKLEEQCTHMYKDIFLKTPLLIYFNFFQFFFPKIEVAKLGMRVICKCGLYAGI